MKPAKLRGIILLFAGATIFWLLDIITDYHLFWKPPFLNESEFKLAVHAAIMDLIGIIYTIAFAIFILKYLKRFNESEARYEQLFNSINDSIYIQSPITSDNTVHFIDSNLATCRELGYNLEELLKLSPAKIIPPDELVELSTTMQELLEKKHILYQTIHVAKDGRELPVEINAHVINLRGQPAILSIARDITERKQAEMALQEAHNHLEKRVEARTRELEKANLDLQLEVQERIQAEAALRGSEQQLRVLTAQILTAEETERQRIATELHDELGQSLMLLRFRLSSFIDRACTRKDDFTSDYDILFNYLDGVTENVRRLSRDLSSSALEELGLSSALRYMLGEFVKHFNIANSSIEMDEIDQLFSPATQINIYRIFQEALTNIARHAQARSIAVAIRKQDDYVTFTVQDDGKGFNVNEVTARKPPARIGLAAMQERARITGGSLELESQKGSGTRVTLNVPFEGPINENVAD